MKSMIRPEKIRTGIRFTPDTYLRFQRLQQDLQLQLTQEELVERLVMRFCDTRGAILRPPPEASEADQLVLKLRQILASGDQSAIDTARSFIEFVVCRLWSKYAQEVK